MEAKNSRPGGRDPRAASDQTAAAVQICLSEYRATAEWSETYDAARRWVAWNARRRWPMYAANDDVWALSVTAWHHNGAVVGRG